MKQTATTKSYGGGDDDDDDDDDDGGLNVWPVGDIELVVYRYTM